MRSWWCLKAVRSGLTFVIGDLLGSFSTTGSCFFTRTSREISHSSSLFLYKVQSSEGDETLTLKLSWLRRKFRSSQHDLCLLSALCVVDVDECSSGTHKCASNGVCTNTDGSYTCSCLTTYTGNGIQSGVTINKVTGSGCGKYSARCWFMFFLLFLRWWHSGTPVAQLNLRCSCASIATISMISVGPVALGPIGQFGK